MRFHIEQFFDAPRDKVEAALLDEGYLARLGELPKIGRPQLLSQERDDGRVHQRVRYKFTGDLAPVVRRVIDPERLTWIEDSTFDPATHRTELRIVPDHYGQRLRCSMTIRFDADSDRTTRVVDGEVNVPMPLVGGKVEGAIVSGLKENIDVEAQLLRDWLTEHGDGARTTP